MPQLHGGGLDADRVPSGFKRSGENEPCSSSSRSIPSLPPISDGVLGRTLVLVGAALGNLADRVEFTRIATIIGHGSSIIRSIVGECYSRFDVLRHPRRGNCRAADALSRHAFGIETGTRGGARSKAIYRYSSCRCSPACGLNYVLDAAEQRGEVEWSL